MTLKNNFLQKIKWIKKKIPQHQSLCNIKIHSFIEVLLIQLQFVIFVCNNGPFISL